VFYFYFYFTLTPHVDRFFRFSRVQQLVILSWRLSMLVFYVYMLVMLYSVVYGSLGFLFRLDLLVRYCTWIVLVRWLYPHFYLLYYFYFPFLFLIFMPHVDWFCQTLLGSATSEMNKTFCVDGVCKLFMLILFVMSHGIFWIYNRHVRISWVFHFHSYF